MAVKWYDESEAETLFQTTFVEWASWTKAQYKGCYSAEETKAALAETRTWAGKSQTALELLQFVFTSPKLIHVVGMRGGYQCFNSTEGADLNMPVVFIDLDGKLTANVRGPHNIHLDPGKCTGTVFPVDNRIALLHEFGHAKQWIETPSMFDNTAAKEGTTQPKWGQARQDKGGGQFDARLGKAEFATEIRDKAIGRFERSVCPRCGEQVEVDPVSKAVLNPGRDRIRQPRALHICSGTRSPNAVTGDFPTAEEVLKYNQETNPTGYKPPVWGAKIEMDNMSRHEWPICTEMGIGQRVNYRDINGESDGEPSLTSRIRRMAEIEKRKNETLKAVILKPGQVKCPYCDFQKSRMFVNNHIMRSHPGEAQI